MYLVAGTSVAKFAEVPLRKRFDFLLSNKYSF